MIKRTLHFGNPAYLSLGNAQLIINLPHLKEFGEDKSRQSVAIEDIGVVILEHKQITTLRIRLLQPCWKTTWPS